MTRRMVRIWIAVALGVVTAGGVLLLLPGGAANAPAPRRPFPGVTVPLLAWECGAVVFVFRGAQLLLRLIRREGRIHREGQRPDRSDELQAGAIAALRKDFLSARSGPYSRDRVRQRLRTLCVDVVSLESSVSEHEARELVGVSGWTHDQRFVALLSRTSWHVVRRRESRDSFPKFMEESRALVAAVTERLRPTAPSETEIRNGVMNGS